MIKTLVIVTALFGAARAQDECGEMFGGETGFCDGHIVPGLEGSYAASTWQECYYICMSSAECNVFLYWPAHLDTSCYPKTECHELVGDFPATAYNVSCTRCAAGTYDPMYWDASGTAAEMQKTWYV